MSLWNRRLSESQLPPCHGVSSSFRFQDWGAFLQHVSAKRRCLLGLPFNIMSYAVLTYDRTSLWTTSGDLKIDMGDTHLFDMMRRIGPITANRWVTYVDYERRYRHHGIQDRRFYYRGTSITLR
jgi:hypothetical protein